jgi:hypothetical protein
MGRPSTLPPASSTAICTAINVPGPPLAAKMPDMSSSTRIFSGPPWAAAAIGMTVDRSAALSSVFHLLFMVSSLFLSAG